LYASSMRFIFIGISKIRRTMESILLKMYRHTISDKFKHLGTNFKIKLDTQFHNCQYISIGNNFSADYRVKIDAWDKYAGESFVPEIIIGNNVSLNTDCYISSINRILIGDGVMMGRNVFITDHTHGKTKLYDAAPAKRELYSKGGICIGNNVLIGSNVCIMPGVAIGDNCIIGANSVVTRSFGDNVCIVGTPGRVCKNLEI